MRTQSNNITTPRPNWSITDQMVAFMLDQGGDGEGISIEDLERQGFTPTEIGNHASEAATIARRRMVRQIEAA